MLIFGINKYKGKKNFRQVDYLQEFNIKYLETIKFNISLLFGILKNVNLVRQITKKAWRFVLFDE